MVEQMSPGIVGGEPPALGNAPKGRRFLAAIFDLIVIPVLLGFAAGLLLIQAPTTLRNVILIIVNIVWMVGRDLLWDGAGPGKKMAGLKVVSLETGGKITVAQAFIRNILLVIPFVLVIGYILEIIMIATKGERFGDTWGKTRVVMA